eukprot:CAMPEP_0118974076 /NCGR_PEP_ID=MMETSP1173-20130426/11058_1 /TAXON_ID=1034831 /ORGANISM="Rhizochromulina marina cf, Strain CCMP1243" /LENGTH=545 /DNA_ID=CAMNT_0006923779 /DNA_START=50 /DNA_END=1687 /DNA_ORIENTATION=+
MAWLDLLPWWALVALLLLRPVESLRLPVHRSAAPGRRLVRPLRSSERDESKDPGGDFDPRCSGAWRLHRLGHLGDSLDSLESCPSPLLSSRQSLVAHNFFVTEGDVVFKSVVANAFHSDSEAPVCFHCAGPRVESFFQADSSKAAIVTCGGICPGLNTVVRELVLCLWHQYGVRDIWGIPQGYQGFYSGKPWLPLDPAAVDQIHTLGGTVLGTSRGGHDTEKIVDALEEKGVNLVFIIGGDGTLRGAQKVADECTRRKLPIAVAGVPKTVDNDIPIIDKSFGFETAVAEAQLAITAAHVEASSFPNGIGIVQLMGRNSGFIALHSTLGSRDVDCVLIPEIDFELEGEGGLLSFLEDKLLAEGHVLLVVAEGSGQAAVQREANDLTVGATDASGNVLLSDVGSWLKHKIADHFKDHPNPRLSPVSLKYIDPTYMVRSVKANAADNVYCTELAHSAVHGSFAGYSGFMVGPINSHYALIPLRLIADRTNVVSVNDRVWAEVLSSTGQPDFAANDLMECEIESDTSYGGCTVDRRFVGGVPPPGRSKP